MSSPRTKTALILLLLLPALLYGALKGYVHYEAKRTVDEIVRAAAPEADIRYAAISTDLRGAVTVSGIDVQPLGYDDVLHIGSVRIASDDPMFFFRGAGWTSAETTSPPQSLSFAVSDVGLPLSSDFVRTATLPGDDQPLCAQGLQIGPQLLRTMGFADIGMDLDGHYRLDGAARALDLGLNLELHDIESMHVSARLTGIDTETLARGSVPEAGLGGFSVALRVAPEFGARALAACAADTGQDPAALGEGLADQALQQLEQQGLVLGAGLSDTVRRFYREWGELRLDSTPREPVALLSLMFLPPEQLAGTLALALSLNDRPVTDIGFTWQGPTAQDLSALLANADPEPEGQAQTARPRRVLVRRAYEPVAVRDIKRYVDQQIHVKPRGQPVREGLLKRVHEGTVEVEQSLHGGKFTVYVPLRDVESVQVLVQREVAPQR